MQPKLKSNLWKYFLLLLTNRRNFIPILSIYFLTLQNTTAQQIGLYTGIGWLAGFLLEIPSGYLSDKFGHKRTLILAKFFMITSTLSFVFGGSVFYFTLGAIFMALGFAFTSGTAGAFLHNTLVGLKREKEYGTLSGKIRANISLVSAAMILLLPLLTKISIIMPIKAYLIFDIVGIFTAFTLVSPKMKYDAEDEEGEKILSQLNKFKGTGFYITSLFLGILGGIAASLSPFREPFVRSLGLPIILIGSISALSRVIWFVVGHNVKLLKKIKIQKLLFYEIFFFSGLIILISQLKNPYIVGSIFAIIMGYRYGRGTLIQEYYLNNFLINKRYKATMLSIKAQVEKLFESVVVFAIGFVMVMSFRTGILVLGVCMFIILLIIYPFMREKLK